MRGVRRLIAEGLAERDRLAVVAGIVRSDPAAERRHALEPGSSDGL
jgi:hypothetical protein